MKLPRQLQSGRALTAVLVLLVFAGAVGAAFYFWPATGRDEPAQASVIHTVAMGDFEAFITEYGEVASSSNVEVRCRIKSRGTPGTAILKICEEGKKVKKDDFLIQFDDSGFQNLLLAQKIVVANDRKFLVQAQNNLTNAVTARLEFKEGLNAQEMQVLEGEVFSAQEKKERAVSKLEASKKLRQFNYITAVQLRADEFAVESAKRDFSVATNKLAVYKRFTVARRTGELEAEIKKEKANVDAATSTLALSQQRLDEIQEQIDHCLVLSPADGQVVYANERDRRGETTVIEEGTLIRENQVVIRLPNFDEMEVDVKINESHYKRIQPGNPVHIELDADPDHPLVGQVKEIAEAPFPVRWHGSPIEYGAKVTILNPPSYIRPGWRAKVRITFEARKNVLQIPLAAVIEHGDRHYCLVRNGQAWAEPQAIKIGANNNEQVIVLQGLAAGDRVSMTPFRHIDRSDLPSQANTRNSAGAKPKKVSQTTRPR